MVLSKGEEELLLGGGEINRMVSSSKNGAVARCKKRSHVTSEIAAAWKAVDTAEQRNVSRGLAMEIT